MEIAEEAARTVPSDLDVVGKQLKGAAKELRESDANIRIKLRKIMTSGEVGDVRNLPTLPGVQSLSIATRYIEGGRQRFIEFVQLAHLNGHADATKWFTVYADLNESERERCSFDDVCAASGVKPSALMSVVTSSAMEMGVDVGNLVAATTHPKVVAAGARVALTPGGIEDRKLQFLHNGFIPAPKGTSINIHASANAQAAAAAKTSNPELPSFEDDLHALHGGKGVPQLPAATAIAAEDEINDAIDAALEGDVELVEEFVDVE